MSLRAVLHATLDRAFTAAGLADADPVLVAASRPEFGDYQANGVMAVARLVGEKPRALAERVAAAVEVGSGSPIREVEVAGPGFLNLRLDDAWLADHVASGSHRSIAVERAATVVVDYSAPNLAKEMHVGHLRSTIIGDAVARALERVGHRVVRQNHVGDWGTQFGMLLEQLRDAGGEATWALSDLEAFYVSAKSRFDADPGFADRARRAVVALQSGDADARTAWERFVEISLSHCEAVYERLGVSLTRADVRGESAYNDGLPEVIRSLDAAGLLSESDGARCVFLDEFRGKDDAPLPVIVQKSDGGYLYATSDLAALRYRIETLGADRILYFVDARQSLHLSQVFAVGRAMGIVPGHVRLEHMAFGMMMGRDGRPFRTREGGTVRLAGLLDEAEQRAFDLVSAKNPDLDESERRSIARAVGIGAVKYADLAKNRTGDYVFDWDQMLSFDGNTAPYLQYARTRVASVFRRSGDDPVQGAPIVLVEAAERRLALTLARFADVVLQMAEDGCPHHLCAWLYDVAGHFSAFYEQCPILTADAPVRSSRLALCAATRDGLEEGLSILGIETIERM